MLRDSPTCTSEEVGETVWLGRGINVCKGGEAGIRFSSCWDGYTEESWEIIAGWLVRSGF